MIKKYFLLLFSFFFVSSSFGQILYEDFSSVTPDENYSRIGWTNFAEEGTRVFQGKYFGTEDNYYVQMSAFGSGEPSNVAWLITPSVYITPGNVLNFRSKSGYTNADVFSLWVSSDFSGDVTTATWTELTFNKPTDDGGYGDWQNSGAINLDDFAGSNASFAFKYTGGDPSATTTIQIDDIKISQDAKVEVNPTTFDEEVESGSVVNTSFTISNVGGGVLTWERSPKSFSKLNYADWELEENQLRLTNDVSITRKNSQGIFNIAQETGFDDISPVGTQWAYGLTHELSIDQYEPWAYAVNWNPPSQVGKDLSMNIIDTDIFFDIVFSSWTGGSNGGGFSLDYTLAQAPWIITSAQSGSISSGNSQVVNVTFDATNLVAGEYHSQIQFYTNDPENPIVSIPVILIVTGEPEINITETSIDYGDVFVNGTSTYELNIENTGTDILSISSIVSDEAAFEANLSAFLVEPKSSKLVKVSFNPIDLVGYNGTLTINSDDADESSITLNLSGNGVAGPEASIDPAFFDVTVTGCDLIQNETLTISNAGAADLDWEIIRNMVVNSGFETGDYSSWTLDPVHTAEVVSTQAASGNNSVKITGGNGGAHNGLSQSFRPTTPDYVSVKIMPENAMPHAIFGFGDETIGSNWGVILQYFQNGTIWINGSTYPYTPYEWYHFEYKNINYDTHTFDLYINGELKQGDMNFFYACNYISEVHLSNYSSATSYFDDVYVEGLTSWLNISTLGGTIGAGSSSIVELEFNSTGLESGTYLSNLSVINNDPLNSLFEIPVSFTVVETPLIELSTASINFLNVVIGNDISKTLVITNTGCETLEVTEITSSLLEFTTDAIVPFTLEPDEFIEFVVTFSPVDELLYEGTLTIVNNDEERVVTLTGEGTAESPVITLSENSFVVTSDICDEIQTYPLTIFNTTGLANLNYEIVQDQGGELVTLHAGTIAPGGSVIENIEIDATGLNSGDYVYSLTVNTNDPTTPIIVVPYTLTVNGLPDIAVSTTNIDFEDVLANDFAVDVFTVINNGCGTLNVTDITSTLPEFTVDITNFSLLPDQSIDVEVTFSPLSNISYNGTLTIVNDDSDITVDVIGVGLGSPTAEVDPIFIDVTLEGCNAIQEQTISIINSGTGDLNWELVAFQDYYWRDSKQPDGPVFIWFDISEIGTFTNLQGDDNFVAVDLPFTFSFYGQDKNSMLISTNGYVTFGGDGTDFSNDDIPSTNDPNDYIAPLWDDLDGSGAGKNYYYHDSPNARFIVQYSDWPNLNGTGTYDFQIHLYANGEIYFYYQNLNGALNGSTIGIENSNGTDGLKIAYNQAYLENNLAIKISNIYPFDSNPSSGTIAAGDSQEVTLTFDANDYSDGTYLTSYYLNSNDPTNSLIEIPVSVTLVGEPEILLSDEAFDFGEVIKDQLSTKTLVITNTGCKELNITDIVSSAVEFTVNNTVFTVLPDETVEVEVTFTPVDVLAYNGTLTIVNDDVEQVITLTGLGIGAPEISATPVNYSLTAVSCDEQIAETLTISNVGVSDLNWVVDPVTGVPTWVTMSSYVGTVDASGSIEIELLIDAAGLTAGVYSSNIVIGSNDPASPSVSVPVSLTVEGAPEIAVSPIALDLGQVNDGDSYQLDVSISNNGCADLEVTNIESDNAIFTISSTTFTVTPGNTEVVTVTYSPVTEGEHTGTLTITSNDAEQTVALAGEALAAGTPIIQLLTSQLDFGDVYLGEVSAVQQYTVSGTNLTENIDVSVPYGFQVSVSSDGGFVNSMSLVQVGGVVAERTIYVRFAPTARTAYSELVSHVSTGAVQKDVDLTGNGIVPPNIYTSVQTVTFNDVYANYQSAEQTYNVSGSGLAEDLIVTAPDAFVISKTSGGDFGSTLSYTPADGIVPTSTVFVKFAPSAVDTYVADIEHSSTGATTKLVEVNGRSLETYTVTFNVSDGAAPIIGAEVALTGYGTLTTDATGVAIFTDVIPEAAITYTVTAATYDDVIGNVTVFDADVVESVTMVLTTYNVTFTVTDGTDPISGAEVALTGYGTQTTDATGIAIFADVLPESGIAYTVTAADYDDASGTVTVVDADVAESVTMVLTTYNVTFTVTDGIDPISGAEVALTGYGTQTTDATGIAIFADVLPESGIAYTVTAADYDDASGTVTVFDADVAESVTMMLTTYNVTFTVTDGTDPISGAEVALTGYGTQTTDATGIAIFADVLPESGIAYTVTATDYDDATGAVTVVNADVAEGVTMVLTTYTVTFTVTDQNEAPIEGAEIMIDETHNLTTNASGIATIELVDGTYSFTVAKDGFEGFSNNFTVNGEGLAIPVVINTTGVQTGLLSSVKVYPNPFTSSITIDNASGVKHIVINNLIGQKVMEVELNGMDSETIFTDKLANGIYLITLKNDRGEVVVKKMVKQ